MYKRNELNEKDFPERGEVGACKSPLTVLTSNPSDTMMILPEEDRSQSKAAELNGFATGQVLAK